MRLFSLSLLVIPLFLGCGQSPEPTTTPSAPEASSGGAVYDLHEWGLVSTGPNGFELAAGPGQQPIALTVDKPVLYVHADSPLELRVTVTPGTGLGIAEHWPPMLSAELSWLVQVTPGTCEAPREYPSACRSADGYCETAELALYETSDAACLTHGDHQLPLLFYRLRADTPPALPLEVERRGEEVVVRNAAWRGGIGSVWRVRWDAETGLTHATHRDVPALGAEVSMPMPRSGGVAEARGALSADLDAHGLTPAEAGAFMRAWDTALFGVARTTDEDDGDPADLPPADRRGADAPVDVLSVDGIPAIVGGPRIADAILYWLPPDDIDALAEIAADPAPRHMHRAILVRADAR